MVGPTDRQTDRRTYARTHLKTRTPPGGVKDQRTTPPRGPQARVRARVLVRNCATIGGAPHWRWPLAALQRLYSFVWLSALGLVSGDFQFRPRETELNLERRQNKRDQREKNSLKFEH